MSESHPSLVSWEDKQTVSIVPDSMWMCPRGDLTALAKLGDKVTPEDIQKHANGRWQALRLQTYPEGFHAAEIIDTGTMEPVTAINRDMQYGGLTSPSAANPQGKPYLRRLVLGDGISMDQGLTITLIENSKKTTQTTVRPYRIEHHMVDAEDRGHCSMTINPAKQTLAIKAQGRLHADEDIRVRLEVNEESAKTSAHIRLWRADDPATDAGLMLALNAEGEVEKIKVRDTELLETLQIKNIGAMALTKDKMTTISDPKQQGAILYGLGESLPYNPYDPIDLRLTASALYAIMGQRDLHPLKALVHRSDLLTTAP